MNLRYRILNIDEERYILDMGGSSFGRILFPFFYWMIPVNVYKVNDDELLEKVVSPYIEQKSVGWQSLLGGIVALGLGNLLRPLIDYFGIDSTPFTSAITVIIIFLLVLSFLFYVNIRCGKKMRKVIHPNDYPKVKLWIRPQSSKHLFHVLFFYLLTLGISILCIGAYIQVPNGFILFCVPVFLFIILMIHGLTIQVGDTTVRFKGK